VAPEVAGSNPVTHPILLTIAGSRLRAQGSGSGRCHASHGWPGVLPVRPPPDASFNRLTEYKSGHSVVKNHVGAPDATLSCSVPALEAVRFLVVAAGSKKRRPTGIGHTASGWEQGPPDSLNWVSKSPTTRKISSNVGTSPKNISARMAL
jgi:hypothetical protein